jgi:hypothetical protein
VSKEKTRFTRPSPKIGKIEANPPHGEKGGFRKVSVTLPPEAYEILVWEAARRKIAGEEDHSISAVVREALVAHFKRE